MFINDADRKKLNQLENDYTRAKGDSLRNKRTQQAKKAYEDFYEECARKSERAIREFNR